MLDLQLPTVCTDYGIAPLVPCAREDMSNKFMIRTNGWLGVCCSHLLLPSRMHHAHRLACSRLDESPLMPESQSQASYKLAAGSGPLVKSMLSLVGCSSVYMAWCLGELLTPALTLQFQQPCPNNATDLMPSIPFTMQCH